MDFDPQYPIPSDERFQIETYFSCEAEYMAAYGYRHHPENIRKRQIALHIILKYCKSGNFDAFIPFLAMNYLDRFISRHQIPMITGNWVRNVILLAVCCLTLAWKMRSKYFNLSRFLEERKLRMLQQDILLVEFTVLNALEWRMRSITALCFSDYFFALCLPARGLGHRTLSQIIIETQDDIRFTVFRPSVISASALLTAYWHLYPGSYHQIEAKYRSCPRINEDELMECTALTKEMCAKKKIWMETAEMDTMVPTRLRVQARVQLPPQETAEARAESSNKGIIQMPPIKEGQEATHREGKEPEQVTEIEAVQRRGKEPEQVTEIEAAHREGKEPEQVTAIELAEEKFSEPMNFELKWEPDENIDIILGVDGEAVSCLGLLDICTML